MTWKSLNKKCFFRNIPGRNVTTNCTSIVFKHVLSFVDFKFVGGLVDLWIVCTHLQCHSLSTNDLNMHKEYLHLSKLFRFCNLSTIVLSLKIPDKNSIVKTTFIPPITIHTYFRLDQIKTNIVFKQVLSFVGLISVSCLIILWLVCIH